MLIRIFNLFKKGFRRAKNVARSLSNKISIFTNKMADKVIDATVRYKLQSSNDSMEILYQIQDSINSLEEKLKNIEREKSIFLRELQERIKKAEDEANNAQITLEKLNGINTGVANIYKGLIRTNINDILTMKLEDIDYYKSIQNQLQGITPREAYLIERVNELNKIIATLRAA